MQIAWIGLGNMGRPMAHNLVKAGFAVRGTDIVDAVREAAAQDGVETADTIADAVRDADVVVTMLPKAQHVSAVLEDPDGVLAHAPAGAVIVASTAGSRTQDWSSWTHRSPAASAVLPRAPSPSWSAARPRHSSAFAR